MKKTVLFVCASFCISMIASAQITKGSVLLGGGINFSESRTKSTYKSSWLSVGPSIGLAVKDNWVIGINANYDSHISRPIESNYSYKRNGYTSGVFARRYISLNKNFYFYGQASVEYGRSKLNQSSENNYFHSELIRSVGVSLSPGITYAINKRFHLEAYLNQLLGFRYSDVSTENRIGSDINRSKSKKFDYNANLNTTIPFSLGFRFVLGK